MLQVPYTIWSLFIPNTALLDGEEMEVTKEPGEEEDFGKELHLARKRIQELKEENRDLKAKLQKLNS